MLGCARINLYTDYERPLEAEQLAAFKALVQRAVEGEPIAYLVGKAHFFNLEISVTRDVLIPRPDTETLVENAIQACRHTVGLETPRILDLCTGSGCIAAAFAANLKSATVLATDISPAACEVARANIERLGLADRVVIACGDLWEPLSRLTDPRPLDLILSNPPYIPSGRIESLDRSVRDFEPRLALDGGADGLDIHRRILADLPARLRPGGLAFLEIQFDQGEQVLALAGAVEGLEEPRVVRDFAGNDRVLKVRRA